jgi:hypothetical protein
MILYHFTPSHCIDGCLNDGLTRGRIPCGIDEIEFLDGWQWLTIESDFDDQPWAEQHALNYDRTAYRITIEVPLTGRPKLHRWIEHGPRLVPDKVYATLCEQREGLRPEDWFIFKGTVRRQWFTRVDAREGVEERTLVV